MESKRQTESVLAKLMGLERPLPSNLLRHGRQKVHSEGYLQDIALICQQQKWSFERFSMDADVDMLERRDSSEDLRSWSSSEECFERYRVEEDKMFEKLWLLNSFQKAERENGKSPKKIESVSQTYIGNTHHSQLLSSSVGKPEKFSSMRKRGKCLGKRERDCLHGKETLILRSIATHGIVKQVANQLQHSVWHDYANVVGPISSKDEIGSQNPHASDTTPVKLNRFPGNMNTRNNMVGHEHCISNSTLFPSLGSSKCRNKNFNVHKDWCLNLVNEDSSFCKSSQKVKCKSGEKTTQRNSASITSFHSEKGVSCEETPSRISDLSEFGESDFLEQNSSIPLSPKEISTCSDVESLSSINKECVYDNAISQQAADDASMPLQQADNGSPLCQMEAYKPNPDSASNNKELPSAAHFSAIHGSEFELQQLPTIFYPEAKRHKRIDVKDAVEGGSNNHAEVTIPGISKTRETQVLSYLVDVLAEMGLQYGNLESSYKLGQPLENPINPFVFDSLEKKYSKQLSWLKSDRKLLFERIKCAFSDLLHPNKGIVSIWHNYKMNKLLFHHNQDIIKEELLSVLVNQEKEAKGVPSDKAVGIDCNWLELEEDMQFIVKEIEEILINELMEEIIRNELLI